MKAELIYVDPELDLALVKVDTKKMPQIQVKLNLVVKSLSQMEPQLLHMVIQKDSNFLHLEVLYQIKGFFMAKKLYKQTAINTGNSGGPLINLDTGLIVGINKSTIKKSSGIGLAIPSICCVKF